MASLKLRLLGQGNIREQATSIREHRLVINGLKAVINTTLCGSKEVLKLSITEGSSAHFRYLANDMARLSACKPPESVAERFKLASTTHHDWGSLDPSQDFDTEVENWKMIQPSFLRFDLKRILASLQDKLSII